MPLFPLPKSVTTQCKTCNKENRFEKIGTNLDMHLMLTFFTCLAWLPIFVLSAIQDKLTPFRCIGCREALTAPRQS